jgi:hypothetical protein
VKKRDSWVIYICNGCGEGVAGGEQVHGETCNGRHGYEEVRVVRASAKKGKVTAHRDNPFDRRMKK